MLDVKHLHLIQRLHEAGSLSAAAGLLHVTQPAVSYQLDKLEVELGYRVFERTGQGLRLTPAGRTILEGADGLLDQLSGLEARARRLGADQFKHYTHGYSPAETNRLQDQAATVAEYLHYDSIWPAGSRILEPGCGVGSQTAILTAQNPTCHFTSVDISESSLATARTNLPSEEVPNVDFVLGDVFHLNYPDDHFDHVFLCFLLEHLADTNAALAECRRVLRPGGTLTLIEGDHGSTYFHPDSEAARVAIAAQVSLQQRNGGDANIGRRLYPLLTDAGFNQISVSPRQIYVDDSRPELQEGFIRKTFTAMVDGIVDQAVREGIAGRPLLERGVRDLLRTAETGGSFSYTFFRGAGVK